MKKTAGFIVPNSDDRRYYDMSWWGLIPNTETKVVFTTFKWYGLQEVSIFVPDPNYTLWFIQQVVKGQYDSRLSTVKGNGFGVFGSVSAIRDTVFLLKNQP